MAIALILALVAVIGSVTPAPLPAGPASQPQGHAAEADNGQTPWALLKRTTEFGTRDGRRAEPGLPIEPAGGQGKHALAPLPPAPPTISGPDIATAPVVVASGPTDTYRPHNAQAPPSLIA